MRILIVEDQFELAGQLAGLLAGAGYATDQVGTLADGLEAVMSHDYPLVLLDRRLPDGDGVSLLPTIRAARPGIRVIVMSALRSLDDRINGLDAGADDYLTKPVEPNELLARIRASLRRPGGIDLPPVTIAELSFELNRCEAYVRGEPLSATKREMLLLEALVRRAGRAVTHHALMEQIYGLEENVQSDALKMLVSRLRQRLKERDAGVEIHSARGIGYVLAKSKS
ncbi:response regulator transcription factor [Methylocystis bryophila]|uniref:Two-component system response regulator n=1 Tax=Methylocystis bryophila TaxID=655015 RepID=A0A1W6MWV7_9HYPH|nr:response regulator transcription factor [Methylocystis bryophila]ARN82080.1 two-component system response regulator [Methylocystis bryophila]BDV38207.1 DNA-binding response regulator [Methylocystis bryophila]